MAMQGNYFGWAPYLVSPNDGIAKYASTVYVPGCDFVECFETTGFQGPCV
jgi:hypothetical protein